MPAAETSPQEIPPRTCPFRVPERDARCVLWNNHDGDHEIAGAETIVGKLANTKDRFDYFLYGPR